MGGFLCGLVLESVPLSFVSTLLLLIAAVLLVFIVTRNIRMTVLLIVVSCGLVFGLARFHADMVSFSETTRMAREYVAVQQAIVGRVVSYPAETNQVQRFVVEQEGGAKFSISTQRGIEYMYGDYVEVRGDVRWLEEMEGSFAEYSRAQGIAGSVSFARVASDVSRNECTTYIHCARRSLHGIYIAAREGIRMHVGEPYASLVLGIAFGDTSGMGEKLEEDFREVGVSHIAVLSGQNISLVVLLLFSIGVFLHRWVGVVLGIVGACLFVLLTGITAPAVRALCMGSVGLLATGMYSSTHTLRVLLLVAFVMCLYSPQLLMHDVGFRLSVLATLGICLWGEIFTRWCSEYVGKIFGTALGVTLAASVLVVPVLAVSFGTLSVMSPLANMLVVPLVGVVMCLSLALACVAYVPLVGSVTGMLLYPLLAYIVYSVTVLSAVPYASVSVVGYEYLVVFVGILCAVLLLLITRTSEDVFPEENK
jgi:ComEC/Rec2-related protein